MTALAVRLMVPATGPIEDLHLQASVPCRAHKKKRPFAEAKGRHITVAQPVRYFPPAGPGAQAVTVRTTCKNTFLLDIVIME